MKILIVEDEIPAQMQLERLLKTHFPDSEIMAVLNSVEKASDWLAVNSPELIFMDVELSDGQCFEIFKRVNVKAPVIITTAYDQFAIKAFKVNSVDYLLKPIDSTEFVKAVEKSSSMNKSSQTDLKSLEELLIKSVPKVYKKRFITKQNDQIIVLLVEDIAYFYAEDKVTFIVSRTGKRYFSEYSLDNLEDQLDPKSFFRLSRACIANIQAVKTVSKHFNSRLKIKLEPGFLEEVLVSRLRVPDFLSWLEGV
ncbi:MAG TPA: LytTR family DNA-binding domain-containing protein [Bacteroidales bacterium]|nr:LytTR family DNA-binding domain-containing protein [Bacteroidales bacterium]